MPQQHDGFMHHPSKMYDIGSNPICGAILYMMCQQSHWHITPPKAPYVCYNYRVINQKQMILLTAADYGCVFALSPESEELCYSPIYENGNINLEEFANVDSDSMDMDTMELFDIRNRLIQLSQV